MTIEINWFVLCLIFNLLCWIVVLVDDMDRR